MKADISSQESQKYKRPGVAIAFDLIAVIGLIIGVLATVVGILDKTALFAIGLSAIISSLLFIGLAAVIDNLSIIAHGAKRARAERAEVIRALQLIIDNWNRKQ